MAMMNLYRFTSMALIFAAAIQWLGVGERIYHGLWQWYKFSEFSNNGHTTVSFHMAQVTFIGSALFIMLGVFIYVRSTDKMASKLAGISASSLLIGVLALAALLVSPIGQVV